MLKPTFEQHRALLLEIATEMTPDQLAEAMKPIDFESELRAMPIDIQIESHKPSLHLFYRPMVRNPYLLC